MGMMYEQFNIDQTLTTAKLLQELNKYDQKGLKKAYNFRLVDLLEVQERAWEVHAEFKNGQNDPSRFAINKLDKGNYRRFMNKRKNPN